jgi:hypothetical protein
MANEEINALIQTIDIAPDPLHTDITPSVLKLIGHGLDGALAVVDLLNAPVEMTTRRASRVLQGAIARYFGFREGSGFPNASSEATCRRVLDENGDSADKWRAWLAKEKDK